MKNTTPMRALSDWQPNQDGRITRMYASDCGNVGLVTEKEYGGETLSQTVQLLAKHGAVIEELDAMQLCDHVTHCFAALAELGFNHDDLVIFSHGSGRVMSDETASADETQIAPTQAPVSPGEMYAWSQEAETLPWSRWRYIDRRILRTVGVVALAIAVAAAVLVALSSSWPAPRDTAINPTPVVQRPIPEMPQLAPDAEQKLWTSLAADGITVTDKAEIRHNVDAICHRLGTGESSVRDEIDDINQRYPNLGYESSAKSVFDGIDAYCPQFDR